MSSKKDSTALVVAIVEHVSQITALLAEAGGLTGQPTVQDPTLGALKKKSACQYLDIGETKFNELISDGLLPDGFNLGGTNHWKREWLDQYIDKQTKRATKNVKRVPPKRRKP